jgi:5-(carboxyamino)imidazole ribonucleotide synthase
MFRNYTKLGILRGGQLGRMLIQSCMNFGILSYVMDHDISAPCSHYCTDFTVGDSLNFEDVYHFGKKVDLITLEFEHINIEALLQLQSEGLTIHPDPMILRIIQDKGKQKEFFRKYGFPTSEFILADHISWPLPFIPTVQKLRTSGYDGKGVKIIRSEEDIPATLKGPCVLERCADIHKEISIIVARNTNGEIASFPAVEIETHPEAHLLDFLSAPADISPQLEKNSREIAETLAHQIGVVGILAVEMFITKDEEILINEISPRPHNSGHHTIEANVTSQYEQHLRAIMGLPLGSTQMRTPSVMINLIGDKDFSGPVRFKGMEEVLKIPGVYLHLYGKELTKPHRKMGHITVIDENINKAKEKARWIKQNVQIFA